MKVKCHFWRLNTIVWRFKHWGLAFMKLTPGSQLGSEYRLQQYWNVEQNTAFLFIL